MRVPLVLFAALVACSDDEPAADPYKCMAAGGGGCFEMPTKPIAAADANGNAATPVLDCAPYEVTSGPVTFTGQTVNLLNKAATPAVKVEVFGDLQLTLPAGNATSDDAAAYSLAIDPMPSQSFWRTTSAANLPLYFAYKRVDVTNPQQDMHDVVTATRANIGGILASVGDSFLIDKSQIFGTAYDCNGNRLVNVIANVAPNSGANGSRVFETGVKIYYYALDTQNMVALHRRTQAAMTSSPGSFVATNVATGKHYLQIWGYPSEAALAEGSAALELIGEVELAVPSMETAQFTSVYGRL